MSAVITNLEDELPLVDRMQDALSGELIRRQEVLRAAGNYTSVLDYEHDRQLGKPLAPLPTLLVVVDEFTELLAGRPEFIDLFVRIGRLGRPSPSTCCLRRSGWRRAGCAGWTRTCPTGYACAPSPPWKAASCSAFPTLTSFRQSQATPT